MPAVSKYIHASTHTGLSVNMTNGYVVGQRHQIPLWADSGTTNSQNRGVGRLSALYIHVNTIAAGATTITARLSLDAAGDQPFVGDSTATISNGITTAAQGAVTFKIDVNLARYSNDFLWCHFKTNAATCIVDTITLTWEE
jgi:hypothetical protein